jgi:hypothetical protein
VIWVDNPEKWEKDTSSKSICIDLETRKPSNSNPLLYKLTLFINTGLVQIQGNKKDAFVHKDFPALLQILDKVTKTVTESRQNLDKEQTALKCVEESTDNKLVITNDKDEDLYDENGPLACCQPLKPDNLFEKIESNFTMALQKICDQQSNLFDKRLQSMEDYYKKSIENNNSNFTQLLSTITSLLKPVQDNEKKNSKIASVEKDNSDLKVSFQELRSVPALNEACLKSKLEAQEMQFNMQKQNHEKTLKGLRSNIDVLETRLTEKGNKLQEIELSKSDMTKALEKKDEELYHLKLSTYQDNATDFKEVQSKRRPARSNPHVILIGTSTTRDIDPMSLSVKYTVDKYMAYTLEETATAVSNIVENPDVIIFHSLSNDVKTKTNEECVQEFTEIIENVEQRFKDTKVIISLPMPRADDDVANNKAQMLGLLVKGKSEDHNVR